MDFQKYLKKLNLSFLEIYLKEIKFMQHKFRMDNIYWIFNLVEWIKNPSLDKSFRWDEWFWFGIVPAVSPYIFYYIWKKKE